MTTEKTTHTPGPWKTSRPGCGWSIKGHDDRSICAIASTVQRPGDENEANARLIAAAPALLEEGDDLVTWLDSLLNVGSEGADPFRGIHRAETLTRLAGLRSAIATATGDQP